MSETTATVVFVGTALSALAIPWSAARWADRHVNAAAQKYDLFLLEKRRLAHLRSDLGQESWRWPIYVRPVLFTPIDQIAQIHFSNAESALHESERLMPEVLPPPEPIPSRGIQRYHLTRNLRKIFESMKLEEQVTVLCHLLDTAQQEIHHLRSEHAKEANLKQEVRLSLEELNRRAPEDIQKIISAPLGAASKNKIDWATNTIENCLRLSDYRIAPEAETEDGSNYAAIYILVKLANYIFDSFALYDTSYHIPSRFELDHFGEKLDQLEDVLKKIVADSSLQDWHALYLTECMMELANRKINTAQKSLLDFIEKQKRFLEIEQLFLSNDFPKLIEDAEKLQTDCTEYWMTREEAPEMWSVAIADHLLPNMILENVRRFHQSHISPLISHGVVIKQRKLQFIIVSIEAMLRDIQSTLVDMNMLIIQLEIHRQAHKEVLERLGEDGDARNSIRQLEPFQNNTDQRIHNDCIFQQQLFSQYEQRAKIVRGANFPEMLQSLDALVISCAHIKQEHEDLILHWQSQNEDLTIKLRSIYSELVVLQTQRPGIDWDWKSLLGKVSSTIQAHDPATRKYSELVEFAANAKQTLENTVQDKKQIVKARKEFERKYARTEKRLIELEEALEDYSQFSANAWQWAKNKFVSELQPLQKKSISLRRNWSQSLTLDTTQLALGICEHVEKEIELVFKSINNTVESIKKQQDGYVSSYNYYMDRASSFGIFSIPVKVSKLISTVCDYARIVPDYRDVEKLLQCADDLLRRGITREEVINIENLIQDYSQKIGTLNVFGGTANISTNMNQYGQPTDGTS